MKTFLAGLQNSVVTTYDKTKTSAIGRAFQKTINSQQVLGPALTQFIDTQTTAAVAPSFCYYNPNTGRLFILQTGTITNPQILLYNFNNNTGVNSYVGKIILNLPNAAATTYVQKGFAVYESGGLIYPMISATGSVVINGSTFLAWGLSPSDFSVGGTTLFAASGSGQKAIYMLQDSILYGQNNTTTTTWGLALPQFSSNAAINTKVWQWNGTLAAAQLFAWDLSVTPTVAGVVASGNISTVASTAFANTAPIAYFSMSSNAGSWNLTNGDPLVINGTAPTAFTAWVPGTLQVAASNVYFLRDLQQQQTLTIPALPIQYTFTTTATSSITYSGAQYTNNAVTYTIPTQTAAAAVSVVGQGASAPLASGTLTVVANQWVFNISAANSPMTGIAQGATYTNNGQTFTFNKSFSTTVAAISIVASGTGAPSASGTLTLASGVGPATIVFTSQSSTVGPASITFSANAVVSGVTAAATYTYSLNGTSYTLTIPTTTAATSTSLIGAVLTGNPAPLLMQQGGVLTLASGTGPAVISFTATASSGWFFNLAATTGGVAVVPTSTSSAFGLSYAFGISNNQFSVKTAPMASTFALGTLLVNQAVGYAKPTSTPANPSLQGNDCLYMGTTTGLYMGLISDLSTNGYTFTIPSSTISAGAVYMHNNQYFTVRSSVTSSTSVSVFSTGAPSASGVLTLVSGTGPSTIAFSAFVVTGNTWASMNFAGINALGTGIDIVTPTSVQTVYNNQGFAYDVDKFVLNTSISSFIAKPYQASNITDYWGGQIIQYLETLSPAIIQSAFNAVGTIHVANGWMFMCQPSQAGQRGVIAQDIASDGIFGLSGVVSPVINIPAGSLFKYISTIEQYFQNTNSMNFWVRSSTSSSDTIFNTANLPVGNPGGTGTVSNGWTSISIGSDLSTIALGSYFQFCVTYQITTLGSTTPAQLNDVVYSLLPPGESSDYWVLDNDNTTQGTASPSYVSFYLQKTYSASIPTMYAKVLDNSGASIFSADTSTNPTSFQYSTNGGTSWIALGTIPNTVGTRLRVLVTPTPSSVAFPTLRES